MSGILNKVKTALRINHDKLDDELTDQIEAAVNDLGMVGVDMSKNGDPLIVAAIKTYVLAHMTDDKSKAELYETRYDKQKSCLKLSSKYGTYIGEGAEDAE